MEQNHTTQTKKLTGTQENVVVGVVAVLLTALLLIFVGWPRIKYWFSTPIIWNDPDYITVKVVDKEETDYKIDLLIDAFNASANRITSYKLDIVCGSSVYSLNGRYGWGDGHTLSEQISVKKDGPDAAFYKALSGKAVKDIDLDVHVRSLYNKDEKIVKQSGIVKIVGLAAVSLLSGILVAGGDVRNQRLRLLLKLLCVPTLVAFFAVAIIFAVAGNSDNSAAGSRTNVEKINRKSAAENYKRAAGHKAGAVMTGRPQDAARAQRNMDRAMADMLVPGGPQTDSARKSAAEEYKRAAGHKAGAEIHGNRENAARAQGQMDKAFADMIAANNSQAKKEYQKWAQHKANAEMRGNQHDAAFAQRQMDRYMADMLQGK